MFPRSIFRWKLICSISCEAKIHNLKNILITRIEKNELLKSAELTGSWEKQLKDIEKGKFTLRFKD